MKFIAKILERVKIRLGITDTVQDSFFNVLIEDTIQEVLNYCNIWELPEELIPAVTRLVIDSYLETEAQQSGLASDGISSMSDAGSSVSFFTLENTAKIAATVIDNIPKLAILNRFKLPYKYPKLGV